MSITSYIKHYFSQPVELMSDTSTGSGVSPLTNQQLTNMYVQSVLPPNAITNSTYKKHSQPGFTTSGTFTTSSAASSGYAYAFNDKWTEKQKQKLVDLGLKYNAGKNCWEISLTATISIPQEEGAMLWLGQKTPLDSVINKMKDLKKLLIDKLTAEMVLAELCRPRTIKEE